MDENTVKPNYERSSTKKSSSKAIDVTRKEMLKQIIEKQKEQDKINQEVIGNQQKLIEKLQWIEDKQDGRKRKLEVNLSKNPAKKADLEIPTKETSSLTETKSIIPTFEIPSKCFVLKHTFENVSKLENQVKAYSEEQEHFGVCWKMYIYRNEKHLSFYTQCENEKATGIWSIETDCEVKMVSKNGNPDVRMTCNYYKPETIEKISEPTNRGWTAFKKWDVLEKEFSIDDCREFVVIKKITPFPTLTCYH